MNVFGHEIDISFIYKVEPIYVEKSRTDAFYYYFDIWFKDGRSHRVEINYNHRTNDVHGRKYVANIKDLSLREQKGVEKKLKDAGVKINNMRKDIIKSINK